MSESPEIPYRRIGTILVEWSLITEGQLAQALAEQEETGRLLGEVLVSSYGISRLRSGRRTRRAVAGGEPRRNSGDRADGYPAVRGEGRWGGSPRP